MEPVELLRERSCSDQIELDLWPLPELRLLLRRNGQNDLDPPVGGFSTGAGLSSSSDPDMISLKLPLFFSCVGERAAGADSGVVGFARWGCSEQSSKVIGDLNCKGRIFPSENSSSADDDSCSHCREMQKSKSGDGSGREFSGRYLSTGMPSDWMRSYEKETLGLVVQLELSVQKSTAIEIANRLESAFCSYSSSFIFI